MDIMIESGGIAFVPKIRLTNAVPSLAHVDRLQPGIDGFEKTTPSVVVIDTIAERERITRTYDPDPPFRNLGGKIVLVAESLAVGLEKNFRTIHVVNRNIGLVDPPQ
ncbi:MAG: hypothetical protein O7I42_20420 [Alphaproteobacteria bacterium]|nr:hypothetical protein [Alphaproteobacteria bacterium]